MRYETICRNCNIENIKKLREALKKYNDCTYYNHKRVKELKVIINNTIVMKYTLLKGILDANINQYTNVAWLGYDTYLVLDEVKTMEIY